MVPRNRTRCLTVTSGGASAFKGSEAYALGIVITSCDSESAFDAI